MRRFQNDIKKYENDIIKYEGLEEIRASSIILQFIIIKKKQW